MKILLNPLSGQFDYAPSDVFAVEVVSTNTSAAANTTYLVDVSGGPVTITLPAPAANTYVVIKDSEGTSETNTLTIAPKGAEKIDGVAANLLVQSNFQSVILVSDSINWYRV